MGVRITGREFAGRDWPGRVKSPLQLCLDNLYVTEYVYDRVATSGPVRQSQFRGRLQRQIAFRLAVLGYFECDTYAKNVDDRTYWLPFELPENNVLNL